MTPSPELENLILETFTQSSSPWLAYDELAKAIPGAQKAKTRDVVEKGLELLEKRGRLVELGKRKWALPEKVGLLTGKLKFSQGGRAWLTPVHGDGGKEDWMIPAYDTSTALPGDWVVVRPNPGRQRRHTGLRDTRGKVIKVIRRGKPIVVGTYYTRGSVPFVVPDDPNFPRDVLIPPVKGPVQGPKPKDGQKVSVQLAGWEDPHLNPEGEILEVLGLPFEPEAEMAGIYRKYALENAFPEEVGKLMNDIPARVTPAQTKGREDLRNQLVFTIDPEDARDFDDALSLQPLADGKFEVGIHIADVGAYVTPGSAVDQVASERGNSTYLVGQVVPMLPEKLSNGLCSLMENVNRLAVSVFITVNAKGSVKDFRFSRTVIRSRKRLTYDQALALLKEEDLDNVLKLEPPREHRSPHMGKPLAQLPRAELFRIRDALRILWGLADKMRKRRFRRGSLDLDMPEARILLDEKGYAESIKIEPYHETHQLIEEYMLAANEAVAKALRNHKRPAINRVHPPPDDEKLEELKLTLESFGIPSKSYNLPEDLSKLLSSLKEHPLSYQLKIQVLRSMKQARYQASLSGHFGLGKKDYLHFTSPIRRYADLTVHRQLEAYGYIIPPAGRKAVKPQSLDALEGVARHLSETEQRSTEAERESKKIKQAEYFARELELPSPPEHPAVITEITNSGMFVELQDTLVFGKITMDSLTSDFFRFEPEKNRLMGVRTKKAFSLGEKIQVRVDQVNRMLRLIDFVPADQKEKVSGKSPNKTRRSSHQTTQYPKKESPKKQLFERYRRKPRTTAKKSVPNKDRPSGKKKGRRRGK